MEFPAGAHNVFFNWCIPALLIKVRILGITVHTKGHTDLPGLDPTQRPSTYYAEVLAKAALAPGCCNLQQNPEA